MINHYFYKMRFLGSLWIICISLSSFAYQYVNRIERLKPKSNTPCVQAFLNNTPLNTGTFLAKDSKGTITVSKDKKEDVLFNITLKSNIGKKDEPPIYLRFIKQKQLNIADILEFASDGDEILIEEFVPSVNKVNLNCSPASIIVVDSL